MAAPFRIRRGPSRSQRSAIEGQGSQRADAYGARLLKLIPAEAVAFYLAGRSIITAGDESVAGLDPARALLVWAILGLVGVFVLRWWGTADRRVGERPQWSAIAIALVSYAVWVYSLGDSFADYGVHDPKIASLLVILWTFVVPFFYRGSRPTS